MDPSQIRIRPVRPSLQRPWLVVCALWTAATAVLVGAVLTGAMLALWATHDAMRGQLDRIQPHTPPPVPGAPAWAHIR